MLEEIKEYKPTKITFSNISFRLFCERDEVSLKLKENSMDSFGIGILGIADSAKARQILANTLNAEIEVISDNTLNSVLVLTKEYGMHLINL